MLKYFGFRTSKKNNKKEASMEAVENHKEEKKKSENEVKNNPKTNENSLKKTNISNLNPNLLSLIHGFSKSKNSSSLSLTSKTQKQNRNNMREDKLKFLFKKGLIDNFVRKNLLIIASMPPSEEKKNLLLKIYKNMSQERILLRYISESEYIPGGNLSQPKKFEIIEEIDETENKSLENRTSLKFIKFKPDIECTREQQISIYNKGTVYTSVNSSIELLDTLTQTIKRVSLPLPDLGEVEPGNWYFEKPIVGLTSFSLAVDNNFLYIIGGVINFSNTSDQIGTDKIYKISLDVLNGSELNSEIEWKEIPIKLTHSVCYASSIFLKGKLYVCGGNWTSKSRGTYSIRDNGSLFLQILDLEKNESVLGAEMKKLRLNCSLFSYKDNLYAVGGNKLRINIEKFDGEKWSDFAQFGDNYSSSVLSDSKIIIFSYPSSYFIVDLDKPTQYYNRISIEPNIKLTRKSCSVLIPNLLNLKNINGLKNQTENTLNFGIINSLENKENGGAVHESKNGPSSNGNRHNDEINNGRSMGGAGGGGSGGNNSPPGNGQFGGFNNKNMVLSKIKEINNRLKNSDINLTKLKIDNIKYVKNKTGQTQLKLKK